MASSIVSDARRHRCVSRLALGNRLTKGLGSAQVTYTYDASTKRLSTATSPIGQPEIGTFTYDAVGSLKTDGVGGTYSYSTRNMMSTATVAGVTTNYGYDADGLRAIKSSPTGVTYYVHGLGSQLLAEYDVAAGTPQLAREYIYLGTKLLAAFAETVPTPALTVQLTAPAAGLVTTSDAPVTLTAEAHLTGTGSITSVQFYANGLFVGSDSSAPYAATWAPTAAGPYQLTARAVASTGAVAVAPPVGVTVTAIGRVLSVSVSPASPFIGQPAMVTVTGNAYSCGAIQINFGDGVVVTYAHDTPFETTHAWTSSGTKTLTASGQANCTGSVTTPVTMAANAPPSVSLTAPTDQSIVASGVPITLTATASDADGISRVDFYSGSTLLGTDTAAPWSFSWLDAADGVQSLTAVAVDGYGVSATSAAVSVTVRPITRITVTPAWPTAGTVAYVTVEGKSDCPVNVDFGDGNVETFMSQAGLPITNPHTWATGGLKVLTAQGLGGTCNGQATTSVAVLAPPSVSLTTPAGGATFMAPATVSLAASASAAQGTITRVDFYANGTQVGSDTTAPYDATWANVAEGSYSLTAVAIDTFGAVASSSAVTVIVGEPPASTVLGVSVTPNPVTVGQTVTITVTGTNPCTLLWMEFGDGDWWMNPIGPLPFTTTHTYASPGTYTVLAKGFMTCAGEVTTVVTVAGVDPLPAVPTAPAAGGPFMPEASVSLEDDNVTFMAATAPGSAPSAPVTVTLDIAPGASGTVTSTPVGFNCSGAGTTCAVAFEANTTVTLTAMPASGQVFLGWGGACAGASGSCTVTATSSLLVTAAFGGASTATLTYYHTDVLGSVRAITNATGGTVTRHDYLAFGESTSAMTGDSRRFTGKERDAETAFDYFDARYYRNVWGRFTGRDPVLRPDLAVADGQLWNRYSYSKNNPLRFADPSGAEVRVVDDFALELIRDTLPEELRSSVQLTAGRMIDVNILKKVKSADLNFLALLAAVESTTLVEVSTAAGVGLPAPVDGTFFYESKEAVAAAFIKLGLSPKDASPNLFLGMSSSEPSGKMQVVVSNRTGRAGDAPMIELAVTMAHEVYGHTLMKIQGKAFEHTDPKVDSEIKLIETRTKKNFGKGG